MPLQEHLLGVGTLAQVQALRQEQQAQEHTL
jgi:hypothetical protein